jgi:hypothetical protein
MAADPREFRRRVIIDADGRAVPLRCDTWQESDFYAADPSWLAVAGRGPVPAVHKFWRERGRGHSKTSDAAIAVAWALAFSNRPLRGVACAGDADQARLLKDSVGTLCRLNGFLQQALTIQRDVVLNVRTGSQLQILASDTATSFGIIPDFIVIDELTVWPEPRGENLWASLFSASGKRAHCLLLVIQNAGFTEHFAWKVRESVRAAPDWHFSRLEGPQASWLPPARLQEQARVLPPAIYDRLWRNIWASGTGDAIAPHDIAAALTLSAPPAGREEGFTYFSGLDLAVSRDNSALVTVGKHFSGRLKLVEVRVWAPTREEKVNLGWVEEACWGTHVRYAPKFLADPYQAAQMCQRLRQKNCRVEEVAFAGKNLTEMASSLVEAFSSRTLDLFPDPRLTDDLRRLRIKESPSGWKLDAPRTSAGHCDAATALSLAVLGARRGYTPAPPDPDAVGACILTDARTDPVMASFFGNPGGAPFLEGRGRNRTGALDGPPPREWRDWDT